MACTISQCILQLNSHGVFLGPLPGRALIPSLVHAVDGCDLGNQRIIRVGVAQQRADGEQHLGDGQRRGPRRPQDVKADGPLPVDIGMVDLGLEGHLGRPEGVITGKLDGEEEDSSVVGAVFRPHDGGLPEEQVIAHGPRRALCRRVELHLQQLLVNALESHGLHQHVLLSPLLGAASRGVVRFSTIAMATLAGLLRLLLLLPPLLLLLLRGADRHPLGNRLPLLYVFPLLFLLLLRGHLWLGATILLPLLLLLLLLLTAHSWHRLRRGHHRHPRWRCLDHTIALLGEATAATAGVAAARGGQSFVLRQLAALGGHRRPHLTLCHPGVQVW